MKTVKILVTALLIISVMFTLAGCGKSHMLTLTMSDCGDDSVELFVTVVDSKGKECGGGNLASGGGNLQVSVPNGDYTVRIDNILYDGSGAYVGFGEQKVTVKGDTSFTVEIEKSVEATPATEPVAEPAA